jgi:hypothetical protein
MSDSGGKTAKLAAEKGENPSLLAVAEAPNTVSRTGGDGTDRSAGNGRQPIATPQEFVQAINAQKAELAGLYDKTTGNLIEKTVTIEGQQLTSAQYRDVLVTNISRLYEDAIESSKTARVPGNEARIATNMQAAAQIKQRLESQYGIKIPEGYGGLLSPMSVQTQIDATTDPKAKAMLVQLMDAITGVNQSARNENQPGQLTMQYADFLRTLGMTKQADTLLKGMEPNTASRYSKQYEDLNNQIDNDFAKARGNLVPAGKDPLVTLEEARKRLAAGDNAGAESMFARAYEQYGKLPQDKMKEEVKRLSDAGAGIDKQITDMEKDGLLTPAKLAELNIQKQQLLTVQAGWEQLQASKHTVQIEHAHYMLNTSATKNTVETRHKAMEMLDEVRFTDFGKLAMIMEFQKNGEQRFTTDLMLAANGKPQDAQAFKQYTESMQQGSKLYAEARELKEKDEDAASVKYRQARMHAENAKSYAQHIDISEAKFQGEQAKKNLTRLIKAENAKPENERNNQKIALLEHMQKPPKDQDPATRARLDNLLTQPMDQEKLQELKGILKDDYSVMEVAQLHATAMDSTNRQHAANQARVTMLQIDVETGKGENNPLTKEIEENDPDGSFRAMLPWDNIKEATRDRAWYEGLWDGVKDIGIAVTSGLAAVGTFVAVTGATVGWGAPAGVAAGLAAGTAVYTALHAANGDINSWSDLGWTAAGGLVNSAAGLVTMGAGGALAGQLGKSAIASGVAYRLPLLNMNIVSPMPAIARFGTFFGAGMAGNMTYHAGMETIHYGQGLRESFGDAMFLAGKQSLSLESMGTVAFMSALGVRGKLYETAFAKQLTPTNLYVPGPTATRVFSQWGAMGIAYQPSVMQHQAHDAASERYHRSRMLDRQSQPK